MALLSVGLFFAVGTFYFSATASELPVHVSPAVTNGVCSSSDSLDSLRDALKEEIATTLRDTVHCPCGGQGEWTNIADLNFRKIDVTCPFNFTPIHFPVRGCKRSPNEAAGCKSVIFSSGGQSYSRVCGRVNAYQKARTDGFNFNAGADALEKTYVDGVSLTHGAPGSRQHIWTFVAASQETGRYPHEKCACINPAQDWPYELYSFMTNNYFCDTGNPGPDRGAYYSIFRNPLWDGDGCGATSACCQFNNPPWFCTTLPQPTTDDIEITMTMSLMKISFLALSTLTLCSIIGLH